MSDLNRHSISVILWQSVLLLENNEKQHLPFESYLQPLSVMVVSSTPVHW